MRLTEVRLQTNALAALIPFYRDVLELPGREASADSAAFQAGETRLVFEQVDDGSAPFYHFAFNIPENQFEEAMAWARRRVEVLPAGENGRVHHVDWNAHALYFYDPAGNILEFIARHNLPNASGAPFSGGSLLSISEIGLPTPDVGATVDALEHDLGLRLWRGGREVFAAVGDEYGLCIIPVVGRIWLATDVASAAYPVGVTLRGDRTRTVTLGGLPYEFVVMAGSG